MIDNNTSINSKPGVPSAVGLSLYASDVSSWLPSSSDVPDSDISHLNIGEPIKYIIKKMNPINNNANFKFLSIS